MCGYQWPQYSYWVWNSGYLVLNGSSTTSKLNSPMYKPVSSNTATTQSSSNILDVVVHGENGSALNYVYFNLVVNDDGRTSLNVSSTEKIWLEFHAYVHNNRYMLSLLSVNVTDGPCAVTGKKCSEQSVLCDDTCYPQSFRCDGIRQCKDGTDEIKCQSEAKVTCDFTYGTCMYYLHNVQIRDTIIYYGYYPQLAQYGNIAYMFETLSYLRSPSVTVEENSCLAFHFALFSSYSTPVVRVATFNSEAYHTVGQWQLKPVEYYFSAFLIYVNISAGNYDGILIEAQSFSFNNYNESKAVDNIKLFPGECSNGGVQVLNLTELIPTTTTTHFWAGTTSYGTEWESETSLWPTKTPACSHDQFPCYNGTCIPIVQICDGVPQCSHSEDESNCSTQTPNVSSTSTSTVTTPWRPSTQDSTTPHHTTMPTWSTTSSLGCHDGFIPCYDGSCIHRRQLCDGRPDCFSGEDEQYCNDIIINISRTGEVILFWRSLRWGDISRNGDLMVDLLFKNLTRGKFSVRLIENGTTTFYMLTIVVVEQQDTYEDFTCIADIVGIAEVHWPYQSVRLNIQGDGCLPLNNPVCYNLGIRQVTLPSFGGATSLSHMQHRLSGIGNYYNGSSSDPCHHSMMELACGLQATPCVNGQAVPVCREQCEMINRFCSRQLLIVNVNNTDIGHYCKFLPFSSDRTCKQVSIGCGATVNVSGTNAMFWSQNFPSVPFDSSCAYTFKTHGLKMLLATIEYSQVTDADCDTDYIQVDGQKYCYDSPDIPTVITNKTKTTIRIQSAASQLGGFKITVSETFPPGVCDYIETSNDITNYNSVYMSNKSGSCNTWIFNTTKWTGVWAPYYVQYVINLTFTKVGDSCVKVISDATKKRLHTVCPEHVNNTYMLNDSVLLEALEDFVVEIANYDNRLKEIYNVSLAGANGDGLVYIQRSDGATVYICGIIYQIDRDHLCRAAGYGSSTGYYYASPSDDKQAIMTSLTCSSSAQTVEECTETWYDSCPPRLGASACQCDYQRSLIGLQCVMPMISCNMSWSDCGYRYSSAEFYLNFAYGLAAKYSNFRSGRILSPVFSYRTKSCVSFIYMLSGKEQQISVIMQRANGSEILLPFGHIPVSSGVYTACVQLPNLSAMNTRLAFDFKRLTINDISSNGSSSNSSFIISLKDVRLHANGCPASFPKSVCRFDSLDVCAIGDSICVQQDVWSIAENMLVGDAVNAFQDVEHPFNMSTPNLDASLPWFLAFRYSQSGYGIRTNDLQLKVRVGSRLLLTDRKSRLEMEKICLPIPGQIAFKEVSFILQTGLSSGKIYLDDISLGNIECPRAMPKR
ncbi:hypothetical protein DPMN_170553 [Dreissena polymorpha]|uniref:Uncharacterized protein n=1 Tax=Dreissena polymorpha TaxID=45954 RepID=A0A9D4DY30_DREPO|nr:hypothetical protein DPMN_170553 [Dreissena polymorpha]